MNVREFAQRHLQPYRMRGTEINPKHCPYCGSQTKDTYTFFLSTEKETFICHRGSCGIQGHFSQLCKHFGEEANKMDYSNYDKKKTPKQYKKPDKKLNPLTAEAQQYLGKRLISLSTLEAYKVKTDENGNIAFPYYDEKGELVFIKYRPVGKVEKGEKKSWREKDGKPILWGMNLCDKSKPLIITEGEPDALALYEAGARNVVSVPSGCKDFEWVDTCWNWLEDFKSIIFFGDNDEAGKEMVDSLVCKLGEYRCSIATAEPYKDANELLFRTDKGTVLKRIEESEPVEVSGIICLSQVKKMDYSSLERVKSSVQAINSCLDGYFMGQTTVWSGINSSGKSTFLGQELIYAIEQGYNVCAYSGELSASLFKYWIDSQIAGQEGLKFVWSKSKQKDVPVVKEDAQKKINKWYDGKFFLFDTTSGISNDENLFRLFEYAAKRYNCRVFLIDNLMTIDHEAKDKDFYRSQSKFMGEVVAFSKRMNVHVHVVAHPRKTTGKLTKMDIMGSADITNKADNVLAVHRVHDDERYTTKKGEDIPTVYVDFDNIIQIFKNRFAGVQDVEIGLKFDENSKRMWKDGESQIKLSWDDSEEWVQQAIKDTQDFALPF